MSKYSKAFAVLLLLTVSTSVMQAQNEEKFKKNVFGILAGGTFSSLTDYKGSSLLGAIGGLYWEFRMTKKLSLMSNILYSQRGGNDENNLPDIRSGYLNMPITLKYTVAGPLSISTGINSDVLLHIKGNGIDKEDFKTSDWGFPLGVSLDVSNNLQLGTTYNIGLSSISKSSISALKNNWGGMTLSYLFK